MEISRNRPLPADPKTSDMVFFPEDILNVTVPSGNSEASDRASFRMSMKMLRSIAPAGEKKTSVLT